MSTRYTYFRTPEGRPYRGQDGKHAPVHILKLIGTTAKRAGEGNVTWPRIVHECGVALRPSCVIIGPDNEELNETDTWNIVWGAAVSLVRVAPGKPVELADFLKTADQSAAAFFRKPQEKYVLISSLSIDALPANRIAVLGCTISSLANGRGDRFPLPNVVRLHAKGSSFADHLNSTKYLTVKVETKGRSPHEAVSNSLTAVDLLRGLWSLLANYKSWGMHFGRPQRKPMGIIHSGPIQTLHFPDGRLVSEDIYWHDPDYAGDRPLFEGGRRWANLEKNRKVSIKKLLTLDYRKDLQDLLVRYALALDQSNPDVAFLQMWGILEKITDTIGAKYEETVSRVAWLYAGEERPFVKELLQSLRHSRNQYVHSGKISQEGDQVAYLMKSFLDPHLVKLIINEFDVRSLEEYGRFLSLPSDLATLENLQKKVKLALKMMKKARAADTPKDEIE